MNTKKVCTKNEVEALIEAKSEWMPSGCREWRGPVTKDGYGQFGESGVLEAFGIKGVHRLSYALSNDHEFKSRNEQVMHQCHNRLCNNPLHLKLGKAAENIAAAMQQASWENRRGELHANSKITADLATKIKVMISYGFKNNYIAQALRLHEILKDANNVVSQIRRGRSWRHITI